MNPHYVLRETIIQVPQLHGGKQYIKILSDHHPHQIWVKTVLWRFILPPSSGSMWKIMSHWHPIIHLGESIRRLLKIQKQAQLHRADAICTDTLLERRTTNSEDTVTMDHTKSCMDTWIRFNWPRTGFNGDYKNNELRFFRAFSSVVRQMPGSTSQRRGTVRTLPN
jgi:hypothetical protein